VATPLTKASVIRGIGIENIDGSADHAAVYKWRGYIGITPLDYESVTVIPDGDDLTTMETTILADRDAVLLSLGFTDT